MELELKKAIVEWLLSHENEWQRVNACRKYFSLYIYDPDGEYLISGQKVSEFISKADELLFGGY